MIIKCCCFRCLIIRLGRKEKRSKKLKELYKRRDKMKKQLEKLEGKKEVTFNKSVELKSFI
tara:strand:+ start:9745 stop:9927 length:183 start_codon:yes stop_codon:yes gene_type:complete